MKKLLLLSLISCMSIIGFTSAVELTLTSDGPEYIPSSYTLENDITFTTNSFSNISCMDYGMISISSSNSNLSCDFEYNNGSFSIFQNNNNCTFTAGTTINFDIGAGEVCESLTLNLGGSSSEGGNEGGNNGGNIIAGGISTFSGTIGRLGEITNEIIPYMIYIFIGYLGIVLIYKAVNMIINYLNGKSKGSIREIDNSTFDINFNDNTELERQTIKPKIYKNNYEREQARKKRIEKNKKREDNVL